jgi:hypothetical protein
VTARPAISIVRPSGDVSAWAAPVSWALGQLRAALGQRGIEALDQRVSDRVPPESFTLLVASADSRDAAGLLTRAGVTIPSVPEALAIVPTAVGGAPGLLACGSDVRGLMYALVELADRVTLDAEPMVALTPDAPRVQQPANRVRSVARLFTSEADDKPWFYAEDAWRAYLSMLAAQRFNRASLTLGLGYNYPRHVTDGYLYFAYPFLLDVPGYRVRVVDLADEGRAENLRMLQSASREASARGLDFQLGLWTHAYSWMESPNARHVIDGLTPSNHAAYCRDALQMLLELCPAITGVTLRIHGESGIPERSWPFWRRVFEGVVGAGRPVGLDLHSKGLDAQTLELARQTGLAVTVSPKYSAEHLGLPYHQAAIRDLERPVQASPEARSEWHRYMAVSVGDRSFTRYGYADFMREDRDYDVVFRVWPGTQRLLLWGDPAMAAALGRTAGLAGAQGLEWCEPLSFKGREGSSAPGPRDGYAEPDLSCAQDWRKFEHSYRLIGRLLYDPGEDPECWRRSLRASYERGAAPAEEALAHASRILPLVTTAHHPSASNNSYWPELYTDMPIVGNGTGTVSHPYVDTPEPRRFGTVSPLDPELFSGVEEFVDEVLVGADSGRYSPLDVARRLETLSEIAVERLVQFRGVVGEPASAAVRRLDVDVAIQAALGRFFAWKLRAAVWYAFAERAAHLPSLEMALRCYRQARAAWGDAADIGAAVYAQDLSFGPQPWLRGSWSDRLPAIDRDIEAMVALAGTWHDAGTAADEAMRRLERHSMGERRAVAIEHSAHALFDRGRPIDIELAIGETDPQRVSSVILRYRRLDQSALYSAHAMERHGTRFVGTISADVSDSPYPLQYHFVLHGPGGEAWGYPGLGPDLSSQPYFVIRQRPGSSSSDPASHPEEH